GQVKSAYPADWYLRGGDLTTTGGPRILQKCTGVRPFVGGSGNGAAFDNIRVVNVNVPADDPNGDPFHTLTGDFNGNNVLDAGDVASFVTSVVAAAQFAPTSTFAPNFFSSRNSSNMNGDG